MFRRFFSDKVFFKTLVSIALPLAIQYFISSSLNLVDMILIGQLGETAVAAVGLANQFVFLYFFLLFGIGSGAAIFTAQFWGNKDTRGVHKLLGICLSISLVGGLCFTIIGLALPRQILSIYSADPNVVEMGSQFLSIIAFSFILNAITFCYGAVLRSVEKVRLPMIASIVAICLNTFLNYTLIFGHFGFPALGVKGSAIATCCARFVELVIVIGLCYGSKTPAAAKIKEMFSFDILFFKKVVKTSLPVIVSEVTWCLGMNVYNIIYAHISTEAIAAINISATIENFAFVLFMAVADASAIMIGNRIGAGETQRAFEYGKRSITMGIIGAVGMGVLIILSAGMILQLYNLAPESQFFALNILHFSGMVLWLRATNMILFIGILRSGGDTKFSFFVDASCVWFIGVPLAYLGAFVVHLPVHWVYLLVVTEEFIKFFIVMKRFRSKRWVNNLTQVDPAPVGYSMGED
jgi:putative MATE family efflux protein